MQPKSLAYTRLGISLSLIATLLGCATQSQNSALQCGAGGAIAAYALCKATGRSDRDCLAAGMVVGGAGALACYDYASRIERRNQALAGREADLDAQIAYVKGINEDSQELNSKLKQSVAQADERFNQLRVSQAQQRNVAEALTSERRRLDQEIAAADKQLQAQQGAVDRARQLRAQHRSPPPALQTEVSKQEALYSESRRLLQTLVSQRERVLV